MIVIMQPGASSEQISEIEKRLVDEGGLHIQRLDGETLTVIAAIGDADRVREMALEGLAGVDRVVPIAEPYKLASNKFSHHEPSTFEIESKTVGPETFTLIAGPCTVESRDQAVEAADAVAAAGASMIRAGIFKPRTSPFSFQGPGLAGLEVLAEIKQRTGLPVVSELTDPRHGEALAEVVDVIQIGARNMQNYALLEVVGGLGRPVLLKRSLSATLEELLMAADYILKEGEERVILCERGIRSFGTATRFMLDYGAIPWLRLHTHLPVIIDPSHAAGDRRFVEPLARAAAAVGADGIIVESTGDPDNARCDGPQQLPTAEFPAFTEAISAHAELVGRRLI